MKTELGLLDMSAAAVLNRDGSAFRLYATSEPSSTSNPCTAARMVRQLQRHARRGSGHHALQSPCRRLLGQGTLEGGIDGAWSPACQVTAEGRLIRRRCYPPSPAACTCSTDATPSCELSQQSQRTALALVLLVATGQGSLATPAAAASLCAATSSAAACMALVGLRTYLMLCRPLLSPAFLSSTRSTTALWSVRMTGQCCRHHIPQSSLDQTRFGYSWCMM